MPTTIYLVIYFDHPNTEDGDALFNHVLAAYTTEDAAIRRSDAEPGITIVQSVNLYPA